MKTDAISMDAVGRKSIDIDFIPFFLTNYLFLILPNLNGTFTRFCPIPHNLAYGVSVYPLGKYGAGENVANDIVIIDNTVGYNVFNVEPRKSIYEKVPFSLPGKLGAK